MNMTALLPLPVHATTFTQLRALIPAGDDAALVDQLRRCATLIGGCWVVNSDVLFRDVPADDTFISHGLNVARREMRTTNEALRRARDYVVGGCVRIGNHYSCTTSLAASR